jgi:hypothetical protein
LTSKPDTRVVVSRPDGRPEAYDIPPGQAPMPCALCAAEGKIGVRYNPGEIVMASPIDANDGNAHLVCLGHLPKNIVIFDPVSGTCRNRDGSHTWREDTPGLDIPYVAPKDIGKLD